MSLLVVIFLTAQKWVRLAKVRTFFKQHGQGNRNCCKCGYCGGCYINLNKCFWLVTSQGSSSVKVCSWRHHHISGYISLGILETFFHKGWRSLTSSLNFRVPSVCQRGTESILFTVVGRTGQKPGGSHSANS